MALITPIAPLHARGMLARKDDPVPTSGQQLRALFLLEHLNPGGLFNGSVVFLDLQGCAHLQGCQHEAHPRLMLTLAQADALSFEDVQTLWEGGVRYLPEGKEFILRTPQVLRYGRIGWGPE